MADRGGNHDNDKPETKPKKDIELNDICGDIHKKDDHPKEEITRLPPLVTQVRASSPSSDKQTVERRGIPAREGGWFPASENLTKTRDRDLEDRVDNKTFIQGTKNHCAPSNIQTSSDVPQAESAPLLTKSPSSVSSSTTNCDSDTAQKSLHSEQLTAEGSYPTKITVFSGSGYQPGRFDSGENSELYKSPENHVQFPQKDEHTSHKTRISEEIGGEENETSLAEENEASHSNKTSVASSMHPTDPRAEALETASCSHTFEGSAETEKLLSTSTQVGINSSENGQRQVPGPSDGLLPSDSTTDDAFTTNSSSNSSSRTAVNDLSCPMYTADCQPAGQPSQTVDAVHCHPSRHRLNQPAPLQRLTLHPPPQDSAQVAIAEMMSWGEIQAYRRVAYAFQILSSHQLCRHAQPLSRFVTDGISHDEFLEYRYTVPEQRSTMTFFRLDQSTGLLSLIVIRIVTEIIRRSDYGEHSLVIAIQIGAILMRHRVQNMVTGTMRGGEGEQYEGATRQTFPSPQLGSNSCLRHLVTIIDDEGTQEYPGAVDLDDQCVDMADDRDMAEGDPPIFPADGEPHEINTADLENVFLPDQAVDAAQQIPVQNGGRQFLQGFVLELLALLTQRDGRDRRVCSVPECGRADSCLFLFNCHDTVCAECYQGTNPRCPYCRQRVGWFFRLLQEEQEEVPGGRGDATEAEELEDMELSEEEEEQENDTS